MENHRWSGVGGDFPATLVSDLNLLSHEHKATARFVRLLAMRIGFVCASLTAKNKEEEDEFHREAT